MRMSYVRGTTERIFGKAHRSKLWTGPLLKFCVTCHSPVWQSKVLTALETKHLGEIMFELRPGDGFIQTIIPQPILSQQQSLWPWTTNSQYNRDQIVFRPNTGIILNPPLYIPKRSERGKIPSQQKKRRRRRKVSAEPVGYERWKTDHELVSSVKGEDVWLIDPSVRCRSMLHTSKYNSNKEPPLRFRFVGGLVGRSKRKRK